jgi:SAM-dependent methyltransferase
MATSIRKLFFNVNQTIRQAKIDRAHFFEVVTRLENYGVDLASARNLDVGCGAIFNQTLMFKRHGYSIVGYDLQPIQREFNSLSMHANIEKFVYFAALCQQLSLALDFSCIPIFCADTSKTPLPRESFDAIISNAVFEHLPDAQQAVRELARLLNPNGVMHIGIHLWPSLSGSHHPDAQHFPLKKKDWPQNLAPWFHLLCLAPFSEQAPKFGYQNQYLNRYSELDYRHAFAAETKILDWVRLYYEGEELLTDSVIKKLPQFTKTDLTLRSIRVICTKQ